MKTYSQLNIKFTVGNTRFCALNASNTRFTSAIPKHIHSVRSYELHYIKSGYGKAVIDGKEYSIVPNTFYVTGPMVEHEQIPDSSDPMEEYCVYIRCDAKNFDGDESDAAVLFENTSFWFGQDASNVGNVMTRLFNEFDSDKLGSDELLKTYLMETVIFAARNYRSKSVNKVETEKNKDIENQYLRIEEYFLYGYQNATLEDLAAILGLSVRQTERSLRRYYGQTFQQKKTDSKMSAAYIMLKNGEKSVTDIAYELGYSSVEHFSNAFKKLNGISPRKYREENR